MASLKKSLQDYVKQHAEEQLQFTIDLCNQNSYSYNKVGTDAVARRVLEHLDGIFPSCETFAQHDVGNHYLLKTKPKEKAVYLVGHMDTVFPADHPFQDCRLDEDHLYGPGTADMKGGLAVIVYALNALEACGVLDALSVAVILNSDEEIGSVSSRPLLERERVEALACLGAECAGPNGEIVVSRSGKMCGKIDCYGEGQHVSTASTGKSSAILELSRKIIELESLTNSLPGTRINVGKIEGGLGPSTVSEHAMALFDIRWEEESSHDALIASIEETLSKPSQPGCRSEFAVVNGRPAMARNEGTDALFSKIIDVGSELGMTIKPEARQGTSDTNFFGSFGIPTLDGFGPVGLNDHTPGEFIHVESLASRTVLLALTLFYMSGYND